MWQVVEFQSKRQRVYAEGGRKMRDTKFRAWHKGSKYNRKGEMLHGTPRQVFSWLEDGQPIELMQFTGLLDKNGKEIYEGDIVSFKYQDLTDIYKIFWQENECAFVCEKDDPYNFLSPCIWGQTEIIGNVWENPQLIKEDK